MKVRCDGEALEVVQVEYSRDTDIIGRNISYSTNVGNPEFETDMLLCIDNCGIWSIPCIYDGEYEGRGQKDGQGISGEAARDQILEEESVLRHCGRYW